MKRKSKAKLIILSIVLFVFMLVCLLCFSLSKAADEYAFSDVKNGLTLRLNKVFSDNLKKHSYDVQNAFILNKENGDIKSVTVEMYKLNSFITDMITDSALCIESSRDSFSLPIGNSLGLHIFSGKGPGIKFTVLPVGNVSACIDSKMISTGINQNLYRVIIRINTTVKMLSPFCGNEEEISLEYVLCEILIVGKVPELYYNREATP